MSFIFKLFPPPLKVQQFVMNFWFFEVDEEDKAYMHYASASVFPKIIFGLDGAFFKSSAKEKENRLKSSGLNGQTNSFMRLNSDNGKISVFGVLLFPYTLFKLTGYSADEFSNAYLDLRAIWPTDGADI